MVAAGSFQYLADVGDQDRVAESVSGCFFSAGRVALVRPLEEGASGGRGKAGVVPRGQRKAPPWIGAAGFFVDEGT
jgi:hypothetical protein